MSVATQHLIKHSQRLLATYPWTTKPFLIGAPMKVFAGPDLAVAVSLAGGLGFIGPTAKPADLDTALDRARRLLPQTLCSVNTKLLPIGVGFQTWDADLDIAVAAIGKHHPCAAWLFAPRNGQAEFDTWVRRIRTVSPQTQIWIQVGTLQEALDAAQSPEQTKPNVLVIQGIDAGGHGRAHDGLGITVLLPEISDALVKNRTDIPLIAAGGIADGRGVASALGLGAVGVAMGTRFLACSEAKISKGYQDEVVRATDGAHSTLKTTLYNDLRGTVGFPEQFSPRTIINRSWHDHQAGVEFGELKRRHDEAAKKGDEAWGPEGRLATYAGTAVGLIHEVKSAKEILDDTRRQTEEIVEAVGRLAKL